LVRNPHAILAPCSRRQVRSVLADEERQPYRTSCVMIHISGELDSSIRHYYHDHYAVNIIIL
jgi:hypothetical protein